MATSAKRWNNKRMLNAIRHDASLEYQSRIPAADKASIGDYMDALFKSRICRNEFVDALVNRIGLVISRDLSWNNPLAEFKRGMMSYGDTVEEYAMGLLEAHTYNPQTDYGDKDVWGRELPDVQSIFHSVNRQDYYKVSVNENMLKRAFLSDGGNGMDGFGLNKFIEDLMSRPMSSDQVDEFLLMSSLLREYNSRGGFFNVHIPDVSAQGSTAEDAKFVLRRLREFAGLLPFVSTRYNAAHMPVFADPSELILICTPEFNAALDVEGLAAAFNVEYTDFNTRKVIIPRENLGIKGVQAILTSRDIFAVWDTVLETRDIDNPVGLYHNYLLHHHQIMSTSLFVPAIAFTTGEGTPVDPITVVNPAGLTVKLADVDGVTPTELVAGNAYQLDAVVTGEDADKLGVVYTVEGNKSTDTVVGFDNMLRIGPDESAKTIKVTGKVIWIDEDGKGRREPSADVTGVPEITAVISWPVVAGEPTPPKPVSR